MDKDTASKVSVRIGVFANARREPDIEERFAHAQTAADSVRNDPDKVCGFYEMEQIN